MEELICSSPLIILGDYCLCEKEHKYVLELSCPSCDKSRIFYARTEAKDVKCFITCSYCGYSFCSLCKILLCSKKELDHICETPIYDYKDCKLSFEEFYTEVYKTPVDEFILFVKKMLLLGNQYKNHKIDVLNKKEQLSDVRLKCWQAIYRDLKINNMIIELPCLHKVLDYYSQIMSFTLISFCTSVLFFCQLKNPETNHKSENGSNVIWTIWHAKNVIYLFQTSIISSYQELLLSKANLLTFDVCFKFWFKNLNKLKDFVQSNKTICPTCLHQLDVFLNKLLFIS